MMAPLVTDTSVVLKWFRQEEILAEDALDILRAYLNGRYRIVVPSLLAYEVANVLRYKSELTTTHLETAIRDLFDLGLEWREPSVAVMRRAVAIAREYDASIYAATFAALAESQHATLVTADKRLVARLTPLAFVRLFRTRR